MPIKEYKGLTGLHFKSMELLKCQLNLPADKEAVPTQFNFGVTLELKADKASKLFTVVVATEIKSKDLANHFGTMVLGIIYSHAHFDEVVEPDNSKRKEMISSTLTEALYDTSISTARGYMASIFKGTFLHNAILPILDPKLFQPTPIDDKLV